MHYITINQLDGTIRGYDDAITALEESIMLNQSDDEHPEFCLYKFHRDGLAYLEARLFRKFGHDKLFWENFSGKDYIYD